VSAGDTLSGFESQNDAYSSAMFDTSMGDTGTDNGGDAVAVTQSDAVVKALGAAAEQTTGYIEVAATTDTSHTSVPQGL